ncbi:MAG: hypothetical protein IJ481_00425 [Alphaproteobacteria bacterium]|nr:hypothetical protein [Alphaproteobacteria bacterium]
MFGSVKVTLIICLTVLIISVLFISYNEYNSRYEIISTSDNSVFIFDKKSTVLSKCDSNGCVVIDTKLPKSQGLLQQQNISQSQMFEPINTISREAVNSTTAQRTTKKLIDKEEVDEDKVTDNKTETDDEVERILNRQKARSSLEKDTEEEDDSINSKKQKSIEKEKSDNEFIE